MNAYLVSHNKLKNNLYMVGALRFMTKYYDTVYFLCKHKYLSNVAMFFQDTDKIVCVPFDENNEFEEIKQILSEKYTDPQYDIFVCGFCHKAYLSSKITNTVFLEACKAPVNHLTASRDTVDFDTLTTSGYGFIEDFYRDIGLSLTHFYKYFRLPSTDESEILYDSITEYYIIFIQLTSSDGTCLNISELLSKYLYDNLVILICNDRNLYDPENQPIKHKLAMQFVYNKMVHYTKTILNSDEIYIIDSCFTGMVLPYIKTHQLKTQKIRIILREMAERIIL